MAIRARELQSIRSLLYSRLTLSLINSQRNLSTGHNHNSSDWDSFRTKSAYEVLGVSQSSSFSEIKSSFRKLAKETHPDMSTNSDSYNNNGDDDVVGNRNSDSNNRFLQILAAYEILSDSKKRAHYDSFLYSQIKINPKSDYKTYNSCSNPSITLTKESNVVEWLKWYRLTIDDIITHKRISNNSTYLEKFESELYTAIRSAYFGPQIESMNFLPDCFEAEERSSLETPELLHLVSGRDLFGIVYVGNNNNNNNVPKLPHTCEDNSIILENAKNVDICENSDLELHICGKVVATASRKRKCDCMTTCTNTGTEIEEDHIHVFLVHDELDENKRVLLGILSGLESSGEEGLCTVFNAQGVKTHVIMKHRTLLVKHMHWYQVGNEVSICECRSRRARLPPSRYWLFEPRCYMHDIGGWYVETFGRDTKGKNVLSPRQWDSFPELTEKRLHPAMYLMALAYRSLDLEEAKRRKWSVPKFDFVDNWYKRYFKWG